MRDSVQRSKRAVILGAAGFVGQTLLKELTDDGFNVVCFDRTAMAIPQKGVEWIVGDFLDMPNSLLGHFEGALVFHLTSSCRPTNTTESAAQEISLDVVTTVRYLEATKHFKMRWVFLSSGGTVYGQPGHAENLKESDSTIPICSYGMVKLSIENYFQLYRRMHGVDFVIARLANPYGPLQNPKSGQGVVAALIYKALAHEEIEIWGDGENIRDYIFASDAAKAVLKIAQHGLAGETYNVGSQQGLSVNRLIQLISENLDIEVLAKWLPARRSDVRSNVLDVSKLRRLTGAVEMVPIGEGIIRTARWISAEYFPAKRG